MKKIFLFIILGLLAAGVVSAQTVSVPESQVGDITKDVKMLPNVIVKDLKISPAENNKVTGTFVMQNDSSDLLGDLQYNIWLMDPMPELKENEIVQDTSNVYDRFLSTEKISLSPKESRTIDFSYEFPSVPAKEYRLRVRAITSKGMGMGWDEKNFNVAGATNVGFATIFSSEVLPENAKEAATPLSGVNVDPSSKVTLKYVVNNSTNVDLSVTPVLDIYNFDLRGEKVDTVNGDKLTIKGGEKGIKEITFKVPKASTAYFLNLWFKDDSGKRVSSFAEFRVVVKGESGRIVFARFDELNLNMARIEVQAVGPADRESSVQAKITTVLFDGDKEIGKKESSIMNFDNSGAITGYIEFPLTQALANPYVKLTLETVTGKVLDTYELGVKGLTPSKTADVPADVKVISNTLPGKNSPIRIAIAVIVCLLALAVVIYLPFRSKLPIKFFGVLLILAIFGATIFSLNKGVWAANPYENLYGNFYGNPFGNPFGGPGNRTNTEPTPSLVPTWPNAGQGQVYYYDKSVWAYINKPIHEGYEPNKTNINLNFDAFFVHCTNAAEITNIKISEAKSGGKHGDTAYLDNDSNWKSLFSDDVIHQTGKFAHCPGGIKTGTDSSGLDVEYCPPIYGLTGKLSSTTTATSTTLRIVMQKISTSAGGDLRGLFKAYLFVNFTQPTPPTVSVKANGVDTQSSSPLVITPTTATTNVTLSWQANNTVGTQPCSLSSSPATTFSGPKAATGSQSVTLNASNTYKFDVICSGENALTGTGSAYVQVNAQVPAPTTTLNINGAHTASDSPLALTPTSSSMDVTLSWTSTNAASGDTPCAVSSNPATSFAGNRASSGSETFSVQSGTNYQFDITCSGQAAGLSVTDHAYANIAYPQPSVTMTVNGDHPTEGSLDVSPSIVTGQATLNISWTATNADEGGSPCTASSTPVTTFDGTLAANGTSTVTIPSKITSQDFNFSITCSGLGQQTASDSVNVKIGAVPKAVVNLKVNGQHSSTSTRPIVINPTDTSFPVTVSWDARYTADRSLPCSAVRSPISTTFKGGRAKQGSESVDVQADTTYRFIITCSGLATSASGGDVVYIKVNPIPDLSCSPSTQSITSGQTANLSVTGGISPFIWSSTAGSISSTNLGASATYTDNSTTSQTVTATVTDKNGDTATCGIDVTVPSPTPPTPSPTSAIPVGTFRES